jgi:rhodanese-related sulfurtransferase
MHKGLVIAGVVLLGLAAALAVGTGAFRGEGRTPGVGNRGFEVEVTRVLEDRAQPWWNNHRPPKTKAPVQYLMSPSDDLGARKDPPIYTAQMPLNVAAWIASGGRPGDGHPLGGRPLVLLDVRRRSEFIAERIRGCLNVPARDLDQSMETGELSKLDRRSVVVAFGSRWPHFEVVTKLRGPKGFEAVYAMEGLEAWKAAGFPVERDDKLAEFLKVTDAERARPPAPGAPPPPPPPAEQDDSLAGLDPLALKALMDANVDMLCVFVGDRRTYEDGHVPGAIHVPVPDLDRRLADVDRNKLVVAICGCCQGKRGGPSEIAVRKLGTLGFKRALHLDGHMYAWKAAGLPVELEDPRPAK